MRVLVFRLAVVAAAVAAALSVAVPAQARYIIGPRAGGGDVDVTRAVVLATVPGAGESFGGLEAPHGLDPLHGYPAPGYDTTGFTPVAGGFGGVILGRTTEGDTVSLYCVDHNTDTEAGIGYDPGAWNLSHVPHLGYVLRILRSTYPATGQPAAAPTANRRAAAVQAAIWFFTDHFVLATNDARFEFTAQIVDAALAAGALPEPAASLSITGPATAPGSALVGPFTVHGAAAEAALSATGAALYADAEAEHRIANGALHTVGAPFWLRTSSPGTARITATATVQHPIGRAMLYAPTDPDNPVPAAAQKLILALPGTMRTTAHLDIAVCNAAAETGTAGETGGTARPGTCGAAALAQTGTRVFPLAATALMLITLGGIAATRRGRTSS